jgi:hypothetical protein
MSQNFPAYVWDPKTKEMRIIATNKPFLCSVTVEVAKFDSIEDAQQHLKEHNIDGIVGELISEERIDLNEYKL